MPKRFEYRRLTKAEFHTELAALGMSYKAFARISGTGMRKVSYWYAGKEDIPTWVPVMLALMRQEKALGTARLVAAHMIVRDNLRPELGEYPYRANREFFDQVVDDDRDDE